MEKPIIKLYQVAYIKSPLKVIDAVEGYGAVGNGETFVGGSQLENFRSDDQEIQDFIDQVVGEVGDRDIVFHK